ncbi:MAG: hypothetical protein D3923_05555 [Candidatus Electrothrix sp. AR3]|nr:hypothetical protein [Candidatus Electrothrix sp. AR3]
MKKRKNYTEDLSLDPGYLMLATYIFGVVLLVLIGWLGAAGAGDSEDASRQAPYEIQNNNVQQQPERGLPS